MAEAIALGDNDTTDELPVERAVKFVGPDTIEGPAMLFDSYDTDEETFAHPAAPVASNFYDDWYGKKGRPLLYDHGLEEPHGPQKIGTQIDFEDRSEGRWAQSQIDKNVRYRKTIDRLIEEGRLGYSSGTMAHLAKKNASGIITRWPWVELSLTPIPAHPGTMVHYVKSSDFVRRLEEADQSVPAPIKAALAALDEWAETRDDDSLPDGLKVADLIDRLSVDGPAWVKARRDWYAKSGRVLSATTRERLMRHPSSLRELADDLDELLTNADSPKDAKAADLTALSLDFERTLARLGGVDLPS